MEDVITTDQTGAESSPAHEVPTDSEAYAKWRMTGETPAPKKQAVESSSKPAESATATEGSSAEGEQPEEKHAPASEAGKQQQERKPRSTAESRLNELLADLRTAGLTPAELKTFRRQQAQEQQQPKAASETTAKPAAAADGPRPPAPPDPNKFTDWSKYQEAQAKYNEDLIQFHVDQRLARERQQQEQAKMAGELKAKVDAARERYGDDAESTIRSSAQAIFNDQQMPGVIKAMLNESPVLVDLMYTMGSKSDEFQGFLSLAKANPGAAVRKLALMESLVQQELAKPKGAADTGESGEDAGADVTRDPETGQFRRSSPAKPVTKAPPPPREAAGRSAAPADESDSAFKADDFRRFREAENRRDIARRKGQ